MFKMMKTFKVYNKEETIKRHREMWNWIADRLEKDFDKVSDLEVLINLKRKAISTLHPEDEDLLLASCYLCEYAQRQKDFADFNPRQGISDCCQGWTRCHYCPLGYYETPFPGACLDGRYINICKQPTIEESVKIARSIANLPEREEQND